MTNEEDYIPAFQIITYAGDARSNAMNAISCARTFDFKKAEAYLKKAKEEYLQCHQLQTNMLTKEANGEKNEVNIILVHAQDHLTMATMAMDNAKEYINIYKEIQNLKADLGNQAQ